jgi:hypothetical protein
MPQEITIRFADQVRREWGGPLYCLSGARCETHNIKVGGAPQSKHVQGLALDLAPINQDRIQEFQEWCRERLPHWVVGMENPKFTTTWTHLQLAEPRRVFDP